jgi:hypothetical protein
MQSHTPPPRGSFSRVFIIVFFQTLSFSQLKQVLIFKIISLQYCLISYILSTSMSRNGSVSKVTGLGPDEHVSVASSDRNCHLRHHVYSPNRLPGQWVPVGPRDKATRSWNWPLAYREVKNAWNFIVKPPFTFLHGVVLKNKKMVCLFPKISHPPARPRAHTRTTVTKWNVASVV